MTCVIIYLCLHMDKYEKYYPSSYDLLLKTYIHLLFKMKTTMGL